MRIAIIYNQYPVVVTGFAMTAEPLTHSEPSLKAPLPAAAATLDAELWLKDRNSVQVIYRGQEYRLSVTKAGKLILTK